MLSDICTVHPKFVSHLIEFIARKKVSKSGKYIFSNLSLASYVPTISDIAQIREWLLSDKKRPENVMARYILLNLNWGSFTENNNLGESSEISITLHGLKLEPKIHKEIALLVIECYAHHQKGNKSWFRSELSEFETFCWQVLLKTQHFDHMGKSFIEKSDLDNPSFSLLQEGYNKNEKKYSKVHAPLQSYCILELTTLGSNLEKFVNEGIKLLGSIVEHGHFEAAFKVIYNIVPNIINSVSLKEIYQKVNEEFSFLLSIILAGKNDGYWIFNVTSLPFSNKKPINKESITLSSLIAQQTKNFAQQDKNFASLYSAFWVSHMLQIKNWHLNPNICFILNNIYRVNIYTFISHNVQHILNENENFEKIKQKKKEESGISSYFTLVYNILSTKNQLDSCENPYIVFESLLFKTRAQTSLLKQVGEILESDKRLKVEVVLKKLGIKNAKEIYSNFMIYQWVKYCLLLDGDEPLVSLFWQIFFYLFFSSTAQGYFFGERLLHVGNQDIKRQLTSKINQLITHFAKKFEEAQEVENNNDLIFYGKQKNLFLAMNLWLQMSDKISFSYLQNLEEMYLPFLLSKLHNEESFDLERKGLWWDYVNFPKMKSQISSLIKQSSPFLLATGIKVPHSKKKKLYDPTQKLVKFRKEEMQEITFHPYFVSIYGHSLHPVEELQKTVEYDFISLMEYSKNHQEKYSKLTELDLYYLDYLFNLYKKNKRFQQVSKNCYRMSECSRAAIFDLDLEETILNTSVSNQIMYNRNIYKELILLSKEITVQLEVSIVMLRIKSTVDDILFAVLQHNQNTGESNLSSTQFNKLKEISVSLFYKFLELKLLEENFLPLSSFCSEIMSKLGENMLFLDPSQQFFLLKKMLLEKNYLPHILPYFTPHQDPQNTFKMYQFFLSTIVKSSSMADPIFIQILARFDLKRWIETNQFDPKTPFSFIESIIYHIFLFFNDPSFSSFSSPIIEWHLNAFADIFSLFQFPSLFDFSLKQILSLSEKNNPPPQLFKLINLPNLPTMLTFSQIDNTFNSISTFLWKKRSFLHNSSKNLFDLFYIHHLIDFVSNLFLFHSQNSQINSKYSLLEVQPTSSLWIHFTLFFDPLIKTLGVTSKIIF